MIQLEAVPITTNSAISIALVLVIVGFVWRQSAYQTKVSLCLETLTKSIDGLAGLPKEVQALRGDLAMLEEDLNNLWAKFDDRPLDKSRRSRIGRMSREDRDKE